MSYDLMVFAPEVAPKGEAAFLEWFRLQTRWGEGHSYHDPEVSTPNLRAWFTEMIQQYPSMNGPLAPQPVGKSSTRHSRGLSPRMRTKRCFLSRQDIALGSSMSAPTRPRYGFQTERVDWSLKVANDRYLVRCTELGERQTRSMGVRIRTSRVAAPGRECEFADA